MRSVVWRKKGHCESRVFFAEQKASTKNRTNYAGCLKSKASQKPWTMTVLSPKKSEFHEMKASVFGNQRTMWTVQAFTNRILYQKVSKIDSENTNIFNDRIVFFSIFIKSRNIFFDSGDNLRIWHMFLFGRMHSLKDNAASKFWRAILS